MKIHARLLFSYMAMVLIPLVLSIIAMFVILGLQLGDYTSRHHLGPRSFRVITETAMRVSKDMDNTAARNPDKFLSSEYLDQLSDDLKVVNSGIQVIKAGQIFYTSDKLKTVAIPADLEEDHRDTAEDKKSDFSTFSVKDRPYTVKINRVTFSDKTEGSVYLITDVSAIGEFFSKFFSTVGMTILFIVVITNGIITFFMSRSITKPLKVLMAGTQQIKNGNLDFQVTTKSKDELGELTVAFEQMRQKLKASIELQLQYEENRKELVSSISHDLKTPITAIRGYVEGIMDGVADTPEKQEKYIQTIHTKANDMDKLIDDLFLFSKMDLKRMPFAFEKVSVSEYFKDCVQELQLDLEEKGILLSLEAEKTEGIVVLMDREKMKRVIQNVIDNSVKYMGREDGEIHIRITEEGETVSIRIRDNGKGISEGELPHIFQQFYRADPSRNKATGGSGLGLAIVKQIIDGHGGRVWVNSKLGEGTEIGFALKKVS